MGKAIRRLGVAALVLVAFGLYWAVLPQRGAQALSIIGLSVKEMVLVIPPIFVLLGLMDVWVPRDLMVRHMGSGSRFRGALLAFVIGSAAAGPLYAAFPIAAVLMRKGASLVNVFIFIGAWSTTKIPMFLFEYSALGSAFAVTRLLVDIPGIVIIALLLRALLSQSEVEELYNRHSGEREPRGK